MCVSSLVSIKKAVRWVSEKRWGVVVGGSGWHVANAEREILVSSFHFWLIFFSFFFSFCWLAKNGDSEEKTRKVRKGER